MRILGTEINPSLRNPWIRQQLGHEASAEPAASVRRFNKDVTQPRERGLVRHDPGKANLLPRFREVRTEAKRSLQGLQNYLTRASASPVGGLQRANDELGFEQGVITTDKVLEHTSPLPNGIIRPDAIALVVGGAWRGGSRMMLAAASRESGRTGKNGRRWTVGGGRSHGRTDHAGSGAATGMARWRKSSVMLSEAKLPSGFGPSYDMQMAPSPCLG